MKNDYAAHPEVCPFCDHVGTIQVEGEPIRNDRVTIFQKVRCKDCHERWTDIYELEGGFKDEDSWD